MASDDKLRAYRSRRNFRRTTEPRGGKPRPGAEPLFVIQKHDASSLHYDFRLEVDGVLKSWAVPKGPSPDPSVKRLAVPTEDHPLAYADFEGVIPEGEYGAGTVLVWDAGTYRNLRAEKEGDGASMKESVAQGKVEVWLEGKKLEGGYVLLRTGGDGARWLLFKRDDEKADARRNPVSTEPASVVSGKTIKETAREAREKE